MSKYNSEFKDSEFKANKRKARKSPRRITFDSTFDSTFGSTLDFTLGFYSLTLNFANASEILIFCGHTASQLRQPIQADGRLSSLI